MVTQLTLSGWRVLADPPGEPQANMERDEELARRVRSGELPPSVRLYGWTRPAVSLGRRQNFDDLRNGTGYLVPGTDLGSLPMVRRPTGGGAVLHTTDEVTYAVAIPKPVPGTSYPVPIRDLPGLIHRSLRELLIAEGLCAASDLSVAPCNSAGPFTLCFQAATCGDLLYRGRKVAGSALRAWRDGLLVQGSIQGLPVQAGLLARSVSSAVSAVFPAR